MTITEETVMAYKPLTSETRVEDFIIPTHLELGNQLVALPKSITRKDPHFLLSPEGVPIRATWISQPLAHILNSKRFDIPEIRINELRRAMRATEEQISSLIKYGVLRDKHGPGAMAFCQANENVPKDSIVISSRTYDTLCLRNPRWKYAKTVMAVRFPNLGPGTTQELNIVVNKAEGLDLLAENLPDTALGKRFDFSSLLTALETDTHEDITDDSGIIDAFYIHPETLKENFEGDGDGDQIFIVIEKKGHPTTRFIDLTRTPGNIKESDIEMLFNKASRTNRTDIKTWLPPYFDDVPIGPATYAIRWILYNHLRKFRNADHPMFEAWKEIAPTAIEMIEFVMDIRKGDWTEAQITQKMQNIQNKMNEIKKAQNNGDWFAKTVTSSTVQDIPGFVTKFKTLQDYVNLITSQSPSMENILNGRKD
jgi:hypothetical protein